MSIAEKIRQYSPRPATLKKTGLCTALGLALLVPGLSGLQAKLEEPAVYQPVAPTIDQARANILIARQLQFTHFRNLGISDELSRSEEHTSELQSRPHLVCRLLLEK